MGNIVPEALERAGYRVERHSAHFAPDASDVDFIPTIGTHRDWIMLTKDARQRYTPDERDAIMRSGVAQFVHSAARMTHLALAHSFVLAAPRLILFRERHEPPFIAKLYRPERRSAHRIVPGGIRMLLTLPEWRAQQG